MLEYEILSVSSFWQCVFVGPRPGTENQINAENKESRFNPKKRCKKREKIEGLVCCTGRVWEGDIKRKRHLVNEKWP